MSLIEAYMEEYSREEYMKLKWMPVAAATIMGPYLLGVYRATQALPSPSDQALPSLSNLRGSLRSPIFVLHLPENVDLCSIKNHSNPYQIDLLDIDDVEQIHRDFSIGSRGVTEDASVQQYKTEEIWNMPFLKSVSSLNSLIFKEEMLEGIPSYNGKISPEIASEIVKEFKTSGILTDYNFLNKNIDMIELFKDINQPNISMNNFFSMGTIGEEAFFTKKSDDSKELISKDESKEISDKLKAQGLLDESGKASKEITVLFQEEVIDPTAKRNIQYKIENSLPERFKGSMYFQEVINAAYKTLKRSVPVTYQYKDGVNRVLASMNSIENYVQVTKKNKRGIRISIAGDYRMFRELDDKLSVGSKKVFKFFSELSEKCKNHKEWKNTKQWLDIHVYPAESNNFINQYHTHEKDPFNSVVPEEETDYNLIVSQDDDAGTVFKSEGGRVLLSSPNKIAMFNGNQPHRANKVGNTDPRILINAFRQSIKPSS